MALCGCHAAPSLSHCSDHSAPTTLFGDAAISQDAEVGKQIDPMPAWFLGRSCMDALKSFICASYIEGCAFGAPLGVCRDACEQARSACSSSLFAFPDDAVQRLECEQYVDGEWPACSPGKPHTARTLRPAALMQALILTPWIPTLDSDVRPEPPAQLSAAAGTT